MRPILTALALAVLFGAAFSGCLSQEAKQESVPDETGPAPPAEFDDATGAIDGTVHDDALSPIEGVQVALAETNLTATSDAEGKFTFSHVPPGRHQLFAQKLGYESAGKLVEIEPGQAQPVELTLVPLPVVEPYQNTVIQRGLFGCGFTVRPVIGVAVCGVLSLVLNLTEYDHFLLQWQLSGNVSEWSGQVYEMEWQSTQALGKGLSMIWETDGCPNVGASTFARDSGPSPLRVRLDSDAVHSALKNNTNSSCGSKSNCNEDKCKMQSRVFPSADTLGPDYPGDVGVTIQQSFTQYFSEFYNQEAPPDYSAIGDR